MKSDFQDKVAEAICEELFKQYASSGWETAKDAIENIDAGGVAAAAIAAMRRYLDVAPEVVARALFLLAPLRPINTDD